MKGMLFAVRKCKMTVGMKAVATKGVLAAVIANNKKIYQKSFFGGKNAGFTLIEGKIISFVKNKKPGVNLPGFSAWGRLIPFIIDGFFGLVGHGFAGGVFQDEESKVNRRRGGFAGNNVAVFYGVIFAVGAAKIFIHRSKAGVAAAF